MPRTGLQVHALGAHGSCEDVRSNQATTEAEAGFRTRQRSPTAPEEIRVAASRATSPGWKHRRAACAGRPHRAARSGQRRAGEPFPSVVVVQQRPGPLPGKFIWMSPVPSVPDRCASTRPSSERLPMIDTFMARRARHPAAGGQSASKVVPAGVIRASCRRAADRSKI